jgi:hypothetical protein
VLGFTGRSISPIPPDEEDERSEEKEEREELDAPANKRSLRDYIFPYSEAAEKIWVVTGAKNNFKVVSTGIT